MEKTSQIQKEKIKGFIYLITNRVNGKKYVGQTCKWNPYIRIKRHFSCTYHYVDLVYRAKTKHGRDAFVWEILICCWSQEDLDYWERQYILNFNTLNPNGYNLQLGGLRGPRASPEICAKISNALKGKPKSEAHKRKMSESRKGVRLPPHSKEARLKISQALKSKPKSEIHKKRLSESRKGWIAPPKSLETRMKLSLAHKGKNFSESHRKRMSEVRKGFHSPARQAGVLKTAAKASKPVLAQKVEGGEFLRFKSVEDAARQLNGQPSCITRVCRGKQNRLQHNGYRFWFEGTEKPTFQRPEEPIRFCSNCSIKIELHVTGFTKGKCQLCYQYAYKMKKERPSRMW